MVRARGKKCTCHSHLLVSSHAYFVNKQVLLEPNASVAFFKVLARGVMLFSEVTGLLQNLKDQFSEVVIYCGAFLPIEEFSQLEDMLIKEKSEFKVNFPILLVFWGVVLTSVTLDFW